MNEPRIYKEQECNQERFIFGMLFIYYQFKPEFN